MFAALIHKAQATIDNVLGLALGRVIMAIPFIIAAGFGIAALSIWMNRQFGPELGNLIVALLFCVVGGITAAVVKAKTEPTTDDTSESERLASESGDTKSSKPPLSSVDHELLISALTTATPIALPRLIKMALRNLPLLTVVGIAAFVLTRTSYTDVRPVRRNVNGADIPGAQPAE
jgi:hypothetical protein